MEKPDLQKIRELLRDRRISVVAREIGSRQETLYTFMAGGNPSFKTLCGLIDYINAHSA